MPATITRERQILFSAPMVRAILEDRKTQTRRVIKPQPDFAETPSWKWSDKGHSGEGWYCWEEEYTDEGAVFYRCPYGQPGDRLWVRESMLEASDSWIYRADHRAVMVSKEHELEMVTWAHHKESRFCSSIHMPRWASRITLEILKVRVERIGSITAGDARAEWTEILHLFASNWDKLNAKRGYGWDANPFVWVIEFKRLK